MLNTPTMTKPIITKLAAKLAAKIRGEMKELSSDSHSSILRDSVEAVKKFHWETVRLELIQKMPSLMSLLSQVIGRSKERSSLLCLIATMILKSRHRKLGLVQRALSVMLYGNGTAKQASVWYISVCEFPCHENILFSGIPQPATS